MLRTVFQVMETVETNCPNTQESQPLKPFWEIIWLFEWLQHELSMTF